MILITVSIVCGLFGVTIIAMLAIEHVREFTTWVHDFPVETDSEEESVEEFLERIDMAVFEEAE